MGIVEKWGTGVKRVRELCKENGLADVEYSADEDFFTVVIRRRKKFPKSSPKVPRKFPEKVHPKSSPELPETLSEGAVKTFKELKKNPSASSTEIGKIIGLTSRAVKKHFAILKEHGLIEYVGSQKGGHWIIKDGK